MRRTRPARAGAAAESVPVLLYHQIAAAGEEPAGDAISLGRFEAQVHYLAERRWQAVSMPELVGFMRACWCCP